MNLQGLFAQVASGVDDRCDKINDRIDGMMEDGRIDKLETRIVKLEQTTNANAAWIKARIEELPKRRIVDLDPEGTRTIEVREGDSGSWAWIAHRNAERQKRIEMLEDALREINTCYAQPDRVREIACSALFRHGKFA